MAWASEGKYSKTYGGACLRQRGHGCGDLAGLGWAGGAG